MFERKTKYCKGLALNILFSLISRHGVPCRPCPRGTDLSMPHMCLLVAPASSASSTPPCNARAGGAGVARAAPGPGARGPGGILATVKISPSLPFSPILAAMQLRGGLRGTLLREAQERSVAILPRCPLPRSPRAPSPLRVAESWTPPPGPYDLSSPSCPPSLCWPTAPSPLSQTASL